MQISKKVAILFSVVGLAAGTAGTIAMQTHAAGTTTTTTATSTSQRSGFKRGAPPAAMGAVTAVSGNTITVTDKKSGTSYTVDASNATIEKFTPPAAGAASTGSGPAAKPAAPATISVSGIAVGDNVMVTGTVSGTSITATKIIDGMMGFRGFGGHGQRAQGGTVTAINGNTITLTGKNGATYTIDASSASVKKVSTINVSDIAVGDTLMVNGTTSGTSITAKSIIDGMLGSGKPASN